MERRVRRPVLGEGRVYIRMEERFPPKIRAELKGIEFYKTGCLQGIQ